MRLAQILAVGTLFLAAALLLCCSSSAQNSTIPVYTMGQRAPAGPLIYTAFDTRWMPQLETGVLPRVPQNRFFLVRMSIGNSGSSEMTVPALTITDEKGQKYQELSDGEGVPQWLGYVRRVKPAEALNGNIAFDAPPQNYKLEVTDESQEKKAIIEIPVTFSGEGNDIPLEMPTPQAPPK